MSLNFLRYDKIEAPHGAGVGVRLKQLDEWHQSAVVTLTADLPTSGKWVKGQRLLYADPIAVGYVGLVCKTSGNGDGSSATGAASGASFAKYGALV